MKKINITTTEEGNMALVCKSCIEDLNKEFLEANHVITKGSFVKARFVDEKNKLTESMWVKITEMIDLNSFKGELYNHPAFFPKMKHGMEVQIDLKDCWGFISADDERAV